MYIIIPGTMGYAKSWHYLDLTRKVIEKAKVLSETGVAEATGPKDVTPEQFKALDEYAEMIGELIALYMINGDTEFSADELTIPYYVMIESESFTAFFEAYFREVYETFNRVVAASSEKSMQVRGPEMLLAQFEDIEEISEAVLRDLLGRPNEGLIRILAVCELDDLFVP